MTYTLIGADGRAYPSAVPGALGGHRGARLYGRLDCPSALRAIARGGYVGRRVFFADAGTAVAAGYRPCSVCLPDDYRRWRDGNGLSAGATPAGAGSAGAGSASATPVSAALVDAGSAGKASVRAASVIAGSAGAASVFGVGELARVVELVRAQGARTVVIGHGREAASVAEAFAQAWDGVVLAVVGWPEAAASWLRQARRFTAGEPDAWVVAGGPRGWAGMGERLRRSTEWDPGRTYGFAATAQAVALAPPGTLEGMRGADHDGNVWQIGRNVIYREIS